MKKKLLIIMLGFLFVGVNVYAAGDLIVNGKLGVGLIIPGAKIGISATTGSFGLRLLKTSDTTGPNWGAEYYIFMDGTSDTYAQEAGGFINTTVYRRQTDSNSNSLLYGGANLALIGTTGGSGYTVDNMAGLLIQHGMHAQFNSTVTLTHAYGIKSEGLMRNGLGGALTVSDFRHIYLQNRSLQAGSAALNVNSQTGLWIDNQALGSSTNYGIVLNGDGFGSDIVFGAGQESSIYSNSGRLYAADSAGNQTIISPHDPETGEWIFYSKNIKTGKTVRVNMGKLVKAVEKLTGETFMVESLMEE